MSDSLESMLQRAAARFKDPGAKNRIRTPAMAKFDKKLLTLKKRVPSPPPASSAESQKVCQQVVEAIMKEPANMPMLLCMYAFEPFKLAPQDLLEAFLVSLDKIAETIPRGGGGRTAGADGKSSAGAGPAFVRSLRVLQALQHWAQHFPEDFDSAMNARLDAYFGDDANALLMRHDEKESTHQSVWFPEMTSQGQELPLQEIAIHMTRLLLEEARKFNDRHLLNFQQLAHGDALQRWVATQLVTSADRGKTLTKLLGLANECEALGNFYTPREIHTALQLPEVRRLLDPKLGLLLSARRPNKPLDQWLHLATWCKLAIRKPELPDGPASPAAMAHATTLLEAVDLLDKQAAKFREKLQFCPFMAACDVFSWPEIAFHSFQLCGVALNPKAIERFRTWVVCQQNMTERQLQYVLDCINGTFREFETETDEKAQDEKGRPVPPAKRAAPPPARQASASSLPAAAASASAGAAGAAPLTKQPSTGSLAPARPAPPGPRGASASSSPAKAGAVPALESKGDAGAPSTSATWPGTGSGGTNGASKDDEFKDEERMMYVVHPEVFAGTFDAMQRASATLLTAERGFMFQLSLFFRSKSQLSEDNLEVNGPVMFKNAYGKDGWLPAFTRFLKMGPILPPASDSPTTALHGVDVVHSTYDQAILLWLRVSVHLLMTSRYQAEEMHNFFLATQMHLFSVPHEGQEQAAEAFSHLMSTLMDWRLQSLPMPGGSSGVRVSELFEPQHRDKLASMVHKFSGICQNMFRFIVARPEIAADGTPINTEKSTNGAAFTLHVDRNGGWIDQELAERVAQCCSRIALLCQHHVKTATSSSPSSDPEEVKRLAADVEQVTGWGNYFEAVAQAFYALCETLAKLNALKFEEEFCVSVRAWLKQEVGQLLPVFQGREDRTLERDISAVFTQAVKRRVIGQKTPQPRPKQLSDGKNAPFQSFGAYFDSHHLKRREFAPSVLASGHIRKPTVAGGMGGAPGAGESKGAPPLARGRSMTSPAPPARPPGPSIAASGPAPGVGSPPGHGAASSSAAGRTRGASVAPPPARKG